MHGKHARLDVCFCKEETILSLNLLEYTNTSVGRLYHWPLSYERMCFEKFDIGFSLIYARLFKSRCDGIRYCGETLVHKKFTSYRNI